MSAILPDVRRLLRLGLVTAFLSVFPATVLALCPANLQVELTDTSLQLAFETDTPGRRTQTRLRYGADHKLKRQGLPLFSRHETAKQRYLGATDILPGLAKLYFDPQVSDATARNWSAYTSCQTQICPSLGEQPGGYSCEADGAGRLIPYATVPADSGKLDLPRLPRHARPDPRKRPEIDGEVTVLTDCTKVQQALNDHGKGGTKAMDRNHEIRLAEGLICRPEQEDSAAGKNLGSYELPAKSGSGVTIITCDSKPGVGPPPGVQYSPSFRDSHSCGFGLNHETVRAGSPVVANGALFRSAKCDSAPCTQGWRFEGLVVEAGDWRKFSPRKVAVSSVDVNTGRMTLAQPIEGFYSTNTEMNLNLPGIRTMTARFGGRQRRDMAQRGCMAARYSPDELGCYGYGRMTGEYEGGGSVTAAHGYQIEGCRSESGNTVCTLESEHGLGNFHSFPITRMQGGVLEIGEEAHGWTTHASILIEGNSACDGMYVVGSSPTPRSAKLQRTGCTGTGGTARRLYMGRFFDLEGPGAAKLKGAHLVDFPAPNQVRAFQAGLGGSMIENGGFVYTNPKISEFFSLEQAGGLTWDRVLFDIGAPFRVFNVIRLASSAAGTPSCDCAIVDSYVNGLHYWQPITPGANVVEGAQTFPPFSAIPVFVRAHVVKDLQMDGITFGNSNAFAFFADNFGTPGPQDITFRRLTITVPDELVGGPNSFGLAYNSRHFIELKAGMRILFDGLQVHHFPATATSGAMPLFISYRALKEGEPRFAHDITFRNIYMRSNAGGIAVEVSGTEAFAPHEPIRRVLIDNWILDGLDYPNRQASPHHQGLQVPGSFYEAPNGGGAALWIRGPIEDVKVSRVTARRLRSKAVPNFLWLRGERANGIQIDRSIISYSPSGQEKHGVSPYVHNSQNLVPPITEGGAKGFHQWATWMGKPDPRSWFGTATAPVGVIPCVSDSSRIRFAFEARNNVKSAAKEAFGCSGPDCDRWNVIIAGRDSQSCAERERLVLDQDLNGIGPFEGLGANTKELARALGYIPAQLGEVTSTGAQVLYAPLTTERCAVDHSPDSTFQTYIRGWDAGGESSRGMQLDGYSPGQTGYYRVLCPRAVQVWGEFTTKN